MSTREEEALLPSKVRGYVIERDASCCRMCGQHVQIPHVHHILYRSQGGKDLPENLVCLDHLCHMRAHSSKQLWQPVLLVVAKTPGVNAIQLVRWARQKEKS